MWSNVLFSMLRDPLAYIAPPNPLGCPISLEYELWKVQLLMKSDEAGSSAVMTTPFATCARDQNLPVNHCGRKGPTSLGPASEGNLSKIIRGLFCTLDTVPKMTSHIVHFCSPKTKHSASSQFPIFVVSSRNTLEYGTEASTSNSLTFQYRSFCVDEGASKAITMRR